MITKETSMIPNFLGRPDSWFLERKTGRRFLRIHGGMQWPGVTPGGVVVLGEELETGAGLHERPVRILAEYENKNPSDIIVRCGQLTALLQVERFYGDRGNRAALALMKSCKVDFSLLKAPFLDDSGAHEVYLSLIREKSATDNKVLIFGKNSTLPAKLATLPSIPTNSSLGSEFPLVTALSYALASLVLHPYAKPRPIIRGYGPLDPGVGY